MMATCKPELGESASSEGCAGTGAGGREGGIGTTDEVGGNASLLSTVFGDSMGLSSLRREETVSTNLLKSCSSSERLSGKLLCIAK
jgi:hypothetical protein